MEEKRKIYLTFNISRYTDGQKSMDVQDIVREEPLMIRVEDNPYSVIMRSPGDEIAHAAGFCLSEGLVESPDDFTMINFCSDDENSIAVRLSENRKLMVSGKLDRAGFFSQTSCGICGRDMIDNLILNLSRIDKDYMISYKDVIECVEKFYSHQEFYARTRGTHAVMLFDSALNISVKAEDVGRHNAMDKAVGMQFLRKKLPDVHLAVLSCRLSFEIIQKAARACIPVLISLSHPTSMAVDLGRRLNMTLICLDKKSGFIVPSGENRIAG